MDGDPKTPLQKPLIKPKVESPYSQFHHKRTLLVRLDNSLRTAYLLQLAGVWGVPINEELTKKLKSPKTLQEGDVLIPKAQLLLVLENHLKTKKIWTGL